MDDNELDKLFGEASAAAEEPSKEGASDSDAAEKDSGADIFVITQYKEGSDGEEDEPDEDQSGDPGDSEGSDEEVAEEDESEESGDSEDSEDSGEDAEDEEETEEDEAPKKAPPKKPVQRKHPQQQKSLREAIPPTELTKS